MRIKFYSPDMAYYVIIRPEDFKLCVRDTRPPKVRQKMPVPVKSTSLLLDSRQLIARLSQEEKSDLLTLLIADCEASLQAVGEKGMITMKLGYKSGYQVSIGVNKEWSNVTRPTLLEAIHAYLKGEFD
jgi:hypothetical protein